MKREKDGPNMVIIIGIPIIVVGAAVALFLILNPLGARSAGGKAITLSQYEEVQKGMSYARTIDILGAGELQSEKGEKGSASYLAIYSWKGLEDKSKAVIVFSGARVASKTYIGLTNG
jgi:hypothetical protein